MMTVSISSGGNDCDDDCDDDTPMIMGQLNAKPCYEDAINIERCCCPRATTLNNNGRPYSKGVYSEIYEYFVMRAVQPISSSAIKGYSQM